ncbi:class I SAM-dependent methyltransferase [Candidatus Pelagibacter sp.]|jgi:ubiquinone/menaquinone biosynthesis C-methylase UbiE|nr:class I SAM-dependent methyltransferase [Candidatus Pelagibacter sp.]
MINLLIKRVSQILNIFVNYFKNTCFYSIFLIKPLKKKAWSKREYTSSHFHKGEDYHERFDKLPGRKIIWNIEQKILDKFMFNIKDPDYLDFAGGTGRIITYLQNKCKKKYLIDASEKMITHAKKTLPDVNFINSDFNKIENFNEKFDLITAFRFFPNAEPHLRNEAMSFISKCLKNNGFLIFNNHKNFWSFPFFFKRLTLRSDGFGMTHKEIKLLVEKHNLHIVDFYSCGLLFEKEKGRFIPWKIFEKLELFFHKFLHKSRLGFNVLYLIKRND